MKTILKHWQNLCKRVLKVRTCTNNTPLLCNQTCCPRVSAAGHRRKIQNSHRKVSNHSKWLLLLFNSTWGLNSERQQFGAWSTRAVAQQRYTSTWTEASLPIFTSNPPNGTELRTDGSTRPTMRAPQPSSQGSVIRQIYFNHISLMDPRVFPS